MENKKIKATPAAKAGTVTNKVIINPPEKIDPSRGINEKFEQAVLINEKTALVLQAKSQINQLPENVLRQVYVRGIRSYTPQHLQREQYAMNRVNSFVAGGKSIIEDYDLIPDYDEQELSERLHTRMGTKGTGGGMRPHIKREKSPYNRKIIYHVVDSRGIIKHTTSDKLAAKKHLALNYQKYFAESISEEKDYSKHISKLKDMIKSVKKDVFSALKDQQNAAKQKEAESKDMQVTPEDHKQALDHFATQYRNARLHGDDKSAAKHAKNYHDYNEKLNKMFTKRLNTVMKAKK